MKNLKKPLDIKHALERKLGKGAMTIFAKKHNRALPTISLVIKGDRPNSSVVQLLANCLKCGVRGVFPEKNNTISK